MPVRAIAAVALVGLLGFPASAMAQGFDNSGLMQWSPPPPAPSKSKRGGGFGHADSVGFFQMRVGAAGAKQGVVKAGKGQARRRTGKLPRGGSLCMRPGSAAPSRC